MSSGTALLPGPLEQITHADQSRPLVQVRLIQAVGLDAEHSQDVLPLAFRGFLAETIPLQFEEDDVLGRNDLNGRRVRLVERVRPAPTHYLQFEGPILSHEDVNLEARRQVNDVER